MDSAHGYNAGRNGACALWYTDTNRKYHTHYLSPDLRDLGPYELSIVLYRSVSSDIWIWALGLCDGHVTRSPARTARFH